MTRERTKRLIALAVGLLIPALPRFAPAQVIPPFFGGGVVAYDPEISVVNSGVLLDAQAVVSGDNKYVTLNMRATQSKLQSLQSYPVSTVQQGFVGGVNFTNSGTPVATAGAAPAANVAGAARSALVNPSPEQIQREARSWILARQGMYLVKPLP